MNYAAAIRPHVDTELRLASSATSSGDAERAFAHLERAHVLGQASTREHVRAHWHMMRWGFQNRSAREIVGQALRIVGAATKTVFGLVPAGNTGGANVSPFRPLPVPADLAALIHEAESA